MGHKSFTLTCYILILIFLWLKKNFKYVYLFWPRIYTNAKWKWFGSDGFINVAKEYIGHFTSGTRGIMVGATYDWKKELKNYKAQKESIAIILKGSCFTCRLIPGIIYKSQAFVYAWCLKPNCIIKWFNMLFCLCEVILEFSFKII